MFCLPIISDIFQSVLDNEMLGFFLDKDLTSANQSGFNAEDSYINKLLSIIFTNRLTFDRGAKQKFIFKKCTDSIKRVVTLTKIQNARETSQYLNLWTTVKH